MLLINQLQGNGGHDQFDKSSQPKVRMKDKLSSEGTMRTTLNLVKRGIAIWSRYTLNDSRELAP